MIDGQPVFSSDLASQLAEAAGGVVLEELVLDRRLAIALRDRGIQVNDAELRREEALLRYSLLRGVGSSSGPDDTARLVTDLRESQGLGPLRYAALLSRSAGLRALVQAEVQVTPEAVAVAHAARYGPRHRIRLIVVPSQRDAAEALARLAAPADPAASTTATGGSLASRFAGEAARVSTDPSAPRGGSIEPFSLQDPAYPIALRQSVAATAPGSLTSVMALTRGFAIAYVEEVLPEKGVPLESVRAALEEDVRLRQERLLMERLAAQLVGPNRGGVTIIDRGLDFGWRTGRARSPDAGTR